MAGVRGYRVRTGSRLHFGLIDMNASLGRVDGGLGVGLEAPGWDVTVTENKSAWSYPEGLHDIVEAVCVGMSPNGNYCIEVTGALPFHVGLGARTQISLAIGTAVARLEGLDIWTRDIASKVGRGGTSGIGVQAFETGGFIVDGGHSFAEKGGFLPSRFSKAAPPPLVFQSKLPNDWVFIVAVPGVDAGTVRRMDEGASGETECRIFEANCPVPTEEVAEISRIVLMQAMPAVIERDVIAFGSAIDRLQNLGFKKIENRLRGTDGKDLLRLMKENGACGAGLSSFGPATFGVITDGPCADKLENAVRDHFGKKGRIGMVYRARCSDHGAIIEMV